MASLTVDKDQSLIGREAAQLRRFDRIAGIGDRRTGKIEGRQQTREHGIQIRRTGLFQIFPAEHIDGRLRIGRGPGRQPRSGNDHLVTLRLRGKELSAQTRNHRGGQDAQRKNIPFPISLSVACQVLHCQVFSLFWGYAAQFPTAGEERE